MKANIDLRIEELVLRGVPSAQRSRIAAAVEAELLRLLKESGLPPHLAEGGRLPEVQVDGLNIAEGAKPGAVGAQIAGAIYSSMGGSPASFSPQGRSSK